MSPRYLFPLAPLCLALACSLSASATAAAPQADRRQLALEFDLPAASLAATLDQIARQSGRAIVYAPELARGLSVAAMRGRMTAEQAISHALSGTGLILLVTPSGILTLDRQGTDQVNLGEVMIDATSGETASGPVVGYVATRSATGSKSDTALIEIPQTVNVVTHDQVQAQGAQNVTEAVRYTPGVVAAFGDNDSRNDVLQSRGFFLRYNLNGSRLPYGAYSAAMMRIEPYGLERIEVLKGPASVLYGQNTPGGLANLISKRPTFSPLHEIQLQTGSNDRAQGAVDLGGSLDEQGTLAYRLTGLWRDSQGEVDHGYDKRTFIAPALTWQPTEDTRLTFLSHYQKDQNISDYVALPASASLHAGVNGRLPRDRYLGEPGFDGYEREQFSLGYLLEHRLNDVWSVQQNLQVNSARVDNRASPGYLLSADGRQLSRVASRGEGQARSVTVDTFAQADFTTGALGHTLLAGVDYLSLKDNYQFASGLYANPLNIYAPHYGQAGPDLIPRIDYQQHREQTGLYLQDQIRLDNWLLTLGARQDWVSTRNQSGLNGENQSKQRENKPTGRIGLAYLFDNGLAPYLSYSTSFEPLDGADFSGRPFKPMTGDQYEAGVKYQPPGSNSFVTLSAFELTQEKITTPDPDPTHVGFNVQNGEARVRGLEIDAKASLHERLDLLASYAYMDSRVTKANAPANGASLEGNELVQVPAHQASLWLDHTLGEGWLQGAGAGFGARYMSKAYGDAANTLEMPGRTLFDASLHYDLGKADARLDGSELRLSANNLFDKRYVGFCQNALQCYYGQRRTLLATLTYRW